MKTEKSASKGSVIEPATKGVTGALSGGETLENGLQLRPQSSHWRGNGASCTKSPSLVEENSWESVPWSPGPSDVAKGCGQEPPAVCYCSQGGKQGRRLEIETSSKS